MVFKPVVFYFSIVYLIRCFVLLSKRQPFYWMLPSTNSFLFALNFYSYTFCSFVCLTYFRNCFFNISDIKRSLSLPYVSLYGVSMSIFWLKAKFLSDFCSKFDRKLWRHAIVLKTYIVCSHQNLFIKLCAQWLEDS